MPKQKTHKGMKKRFKITASGKAVHRKVNRGHMLSNKPGSKIRHNRQDALISGVRARKIVDALRPSL
ncbi:MAG: 50S ribosomal protein L35 [Planctomycetaceae bacterium]